MNASDRPCWQLCPVCYRCANKGTRIACGSCSGRHDPQERRDLYDTDDQCRCTEGILQFRLQSGRMVRRRYASNPFRTTVRTDAEDADELDWNAYISENRERFDDPGWDPVRLSDGRSTFDWMKAQRAGH